MCGLGSCVEGKCQVAELTECKEAECTGGQTKINKCGTGEELTVEICDEGLWSKTGVECGGISEEIKAVKEVKEGGEEAVVNEEPISGDECSTRSDCGGEDDVCSNGRCITIPENAGGEVKEEPQKEESTEEGTKPEEEKEAPQESPSEEKTEEAPPKSEEPEASEAPPEEPSPEPTITGEVIRAPLKNAFGLFL